MVELQRQGAVSRPAPVLAPYIAFYSGYDWMGAAPGRHRGLPASYLNLVITFEAPLRVGTPTSVHEADHRCASRAATSWPPAATRSFETSVGGLHLDPVDIRHDGRMDGIFIALRPRGARGLLGVPAGALVSQVEDLEAVLGTAVGPLRDRLASANSWKARFAILDAEFARRARIVDVPLRAADRIWERMAVSGGREPVAAIADDLGWSRRHLGTLFRDEFGLSPKSLARILRFERSRRLIEAAPEARFADVAAACGFADHAHLTREWSALAGCPPRTWLAEEPVGAAEASTAT